MKNNIYLFLFCVIFMACSKKQKNVKTPTKSAIKKDTVKVVKKEIIEKVPELVFTVQLAALRKPNRKIANLANVKNYKEKSLNKYRFGVFKTYKEAKKVKLELQYIYKGAFIQALKGDIPINIKKALK